MSAPSLLPKPHLFRNHQTRNRKPWKPLPLTLPRSSPPTPQASKSPINQEEEQRPSTPPVSSHPLHSLIDSIKSFSSDGHLSKAFNAFSSLRLHSFSSLLLPLPLPISSLLSCSTSLRALPQGRQLHSLILSLGLQDDPSLVPRLTTFYATFNLLSDARAAVFSSKTFHVLPWNLLISACVRDGFPADALLAYKEMARRGVEPDHFTFPSVLKACSEVLDLDLGKEVHRCIENSGMGWNLFACNALVAMYSKCGELDIARKLFDEMPERDVVTWNSMISGYASKGMWEKAFELFESMRAEGSELNSMTWNAIIGGSLQMGNYREALRLISQMSTSGSDMDFVTLIVGLNACSRIGSLRLGKEIHGFAIRTFCDGLETVTNALITMYSRCNDMNCANALFRMAEVRSLVTWNAMIAGFALSDQAEEASLVFRDMVYSGVEPNYVTVVTYLALCARVANLQHGRELHCFIVKHGFKGYRLLWNSLIDMYSKSGRILVARKVFDMMSDRDEVSYTSMIAGCGMQGEGITALKLFDEMIRSGIKPDHIAMVAVLSACSHSGLVSQGQALFEQMVDSYKVVPRMEHYSCMVDLFSRAGLLRKAEEILDRTPFRPTAAMWAALVGACQVYGNTEIGERAARKLLEMRTDNAGHYVLIANMYAAAGCWEGLAQVRTMMRDLGVRKAPGLAWADLGTGFHPFVVGDRSNPLSPEIYEMLEGLTEQMRDIGYVGNVDLFSEEETKD